MNELDANAKVAITGVLVFKDTDGNVVKETPFTGELKEDKEEEDGDVRE